MQWLTLNPESVNLQRLQADNRRPATAQAVDSVAPYPDVHPAQVGEAGQKRRQDQRRQGDRRRGGDRRRKQLPVILDTRSQHDRRAVAGRRADDTTADTGAPPRKRISVYA